MEVVGVLLQVVCHLRMVVFGVDWRVAADSLVAREVQALVQGRREGTLRIAQRFDLVVQSQGVRPFFRVCGSVRVFLQLPVRVRGVSDARVRQRHFVDFLGNAQAVQLLARSGLARRDELWLGVGDEAVDFGDGLRRRDEQELDFDSKSSDLRSEQVFVCGDSRVPFEKVV